MPKITSIEELTKIKKAVEPKLKIRNDANFGHFKSTPEICIQQCRGMGCTAAGGDKVTELFEELIKKKGLDSKITIVRTGCLGPCEMGPTVIVNPGDVLYVRVKPEDVKEIFEKHILKGEIVERLVYHDPTTNEALPNRSKINFLADQEIRILHNNGVIDPWNIEEYIARGGYEALGKALYKMKPDDVLEEVKKAGLKGRGGAGFPTATKWGFLKSSPGTVKYLVCNGDEGDPGAYMNRAVLEGNPHSIIEGMALGAYAVGNVKQGFAYIRAEYPLAIETLSAAIAQARDYGLLGKNIMGTDFEFNLDIFPGAGAFVCGEETALLISIEGKRGMPRQRPPFPSDKGLFGKPTAINNVETWSIVPRIIREGADWFSGVGSEKSKGTKSFSLVGKVNNVGLVEVPLGTSLGKIVFDIGGGIPKGKKYKATQMGGPSGGVIPIEHVNVPVDYESVTALGAIMGSGGLVVMDEDNCMVDIAKMFLGFTRDESCGKCVPCRAGIPKLLALLTKITSGKGTLEDIDTIIELSEMIQKASICGLGQTAPNPAVSTIRHFREEYEAHIIDKKCPAVMCQALFRAPCQHTCPVGLDVPGYVALIKGDKPAEAYKLIMQRLPLPMTVGRVCPHPCESKCRRGQVDEPISIRHLKRYASDYAYEHGLSYTPAIKASKSGKVAVIGAGPAGLSAAWDLAVEGYKVTIFEALPVAGGMLAVGIPEYRLPKAILNAEIDNIKKLGIEIKLNTVVKDIDALFKEGYKAVFVAIGAHKGDKMGIPGEELEGVYDAIDFLRNINLGKFINVGKKVAVIGGGNSAIDAARVALRKGAEEVHIVYRREKADMPAEEEEIAAAIEEGIKLHVLTAPVKVTGKGGKVAGIECNKMALGDFDKSGRRSPKPIHGSEYTIEVDMLIEAIGQRPDTASMNLGNAKIGKGGTLTADKRTLATEQKGVFVGGDAFTGPWTVIEAIASGQRAASSIKRFLTGKELGPRVDRQDAETFEYSQVPPTDEETAERARVGIAEIRLADRKTTSKEVVVGYTAKEAKEECSRCLRCDIG
ncbi:MAG: FAD-dependent oxidoreductase [Chloroflexi bacterium]|nr:FAD-dependent oxidoreductase [Chloroflexota bacterium]